MSPVQGYDRARTAPLGQHHIGSIRHADRLASVLHDDRAGVYHVLDAECGKFPSTSAEFVEYCQFGVHSVPGGYK